MKRFLPGITLILLVLSPACGSRPSRAVLGLGVAANIVEVRGGRMRFLKSIP